MNRTAGTLLGILLVAVLVAVIWWMYPRPADSPVLPSSPESTASEADDPDIAADTPDAEYPVPESADDHGPSELDQDTADDELRSASPPPPPILEESDRFLRSLLRRIFSATVLEEWLKQDRIVERIVVTINSLDGPAISLRFWPVRHIEGLPTIERSGDTLRWSEVNTERYRPLIEILRATDPEEVAEVYFRSYPLFQQAYDSLGLEEAHFNDRLVEIVDHLLGAPAIEPGFEVKQPKVLYEFADPALESQSWGRKLLIRMGPDNAAIVKDWLRALRKELVAGNPSGEQTADDS